GRRAHHHLREQPPREPRPALHDRPSASGPRLGARHGPPPRRRVIGAVVRERGAPAPLRSPPHAAWCFERAAHRRPQARPPRPPPPAPRPRPPRRARIPISPPCSYAIGRAPTRAVASPRPSLHFREGGARRRGLSCGVESRERARRWSALSRRCV